MESVSGGESSSRRSRAGIKGELLLPQRVRVAAVPESRYQPGQRPLLWNQRVPGTDRIQTADGCEFLLASTGGQSSPAPGWELLLTKEVKTEAGQTAYQWTLYGIRKNAAC